MPENQSPCFAWIWSNSLEIHGIASQDFETVTIVKLKLGLGAPKPTRPSYDVVGKLQPASLRQPFQVMTIFQTTIPVASRTLRCRWIIRHSLLHVLAIVAFAFFPVAASEPSVSEAETAEAIQMAVEELNSSSFAVRERATRDLWGFGEQVRPLLLKLVESDNLEARQRSMQILADFEFGITPDVPPHIAKLLRQYRSGTMESRMQVLAILVAEGDLRPLQSLAKRSADRRMRHVIYARSIESTPLMIGLIERDELDEWIEVMSKDEFRQSRHETVSKWLTSSGVLEELGSLDQLSVVDLAIAQEENDGNRNRLLRRLFVQREFTDYYSDPERIGTMLKFIETLSNRSERHDLFVRFLSLTRDPTIYDPPSFSKLQRFATDECTRKTLDDFWNYMIETIFQRPEIVSQMTRDRLSALAIQLDESHSVRLQQTIREHAPHLAQLLVR